MIELEEDKISIDYEKRCKKLEEMICEQREKINHEWQNKFENEVERTSEIIKKLETENKFYKDIIKSVLHI